MPDDEVGGIRAEITADASQLYAVLQRAEQSLRAFDSRWGKINVQISASMAGIAQAEQRVQQLQRQVQQTTQALPPQQPTRQAAPVQQPARQAQPVQQAAAQPAEPIARPAAPVAVAAQPVQDEGEIRAAAQASADATGRRVQYRLANGVIRAVNPVGGGPVGSSGTGFQIGGTQFGPRGIRGAEEAGGAPTESEVIRSLQARVRELEASGPAQVAAGRRQLSEAELEQRRAAGRSSYEQAVAEGRIGPTGFLPRPKPEVAAQVAPQAAPQPAQPTAGQEPEDIIRRRPQIEARAAERDVARSRQAEILALARVIKGPEATSAELTSEFSPQAIANQMRIIRSQQPEVFQEYFEAAQKELTEAASDEARRVRRDRARPTPQERASIIEADPALQEALARSREAATTRIQAQAATTIRAPGTFLGGLVATAAGRAEAAEAQQQLGKARTDELRITEGLINARFKLTDITKQLNEEEDPDKQEALLAQYDEQVKSVERLSGALVEAGQNTEFWRQETEKLAGGGARNLAAGFIGGIGASLVFGVGMAAITQGVELLGKAIDPMVERITGYIGVTNRITSALSDQARQQHGLTDVVVAAAFAEAALGESTANTIRPFLEQRVSIEAGNKALQTQIDLIRSAAQIQEQTQRAQLGLAPGPLQRPGAIPGITTGTGGLLGTPFLQQPGVVEQLAALTPQAGARSNAQLAGIGGALAGGVTGAIGGALIGGVGAIPGAIIGALAGAGIAGGVTSAANQPGSPFRLGAPQNPRLQQEFFAREAEVAAGRLDVLNLAINDLNEAADRGARGVDTLVQAQTEASQQQVEATSALLEAMGAPREQIENLAAAGFALQGLTGNFEQRLEQAKDFFESASRGAAIPSLPDVTQQLRERIIPARLFQIAAEGALQRDFIRLQAGAQRAAQPFLPFGTTVPGGIGAVSPQLRQFLGGVGPAPGLVQGLDLLNVARIQATRVEIANLVQPQERAGALATFGRLQGLGQVAAGLQTFITQSQVNLATAQYNEQLRQARLSLTDLAQLTGRIGATSGDNLGIAERQLITYQRQTQQLQIQLATLQLELQQRQINFQVAIAGFTAPGITPAERAARIEQAELEASYAQQQLDLQKQILANQAQSVPLQIQIQDIQFQRDYITAQRAIALLTQARTVTIDVAAAQEALQRVNAEIEITAAEFQTYIQSAQQAASAAITDVASQMATYEGKAIDFFDAVGGAYQRQFTRYMTHIIAQIQRGLNAIPQYGATSNVGGVQEHAAQTGFYGQVDRPTTFTVGEAGAETIAVLRNPRQMTGWTGGGMQVVLNINITGNTIRSEDDIEKLASTVARKVEESLSRRTSLLGFRPVG